MKAVIFDMDGVLIDSEPQHLEADVLTLAKYNVNLDPESLRGFTGMDNIKFFSRIIKDYNLNVTPEELLSLKDTILIESYRNKLVLVPFINEMYNELKNLDNIKFAIASSSSRELVSFVIKNLKWEQFIDTSVAGDEVVEAKPNPSIFLKAAELLNVEPHECLVIEDSEHGVQAAISAGMKVIGFINPNSGKQDLKMASEVVENLKDFVLLIKREHKERVQNACDY